jgi:hypothetical protein
MDGIIANGTSGKLLAASKSEDLRGAATISKDPVLWHGRNPAEMEQVRTPPFEP